MKVGDLVAVGEKVGGDYSVGVIIEDCPPENHRNGMHLINVLHEDYTRWWPAGYVRKINESR